MKKATALIAAVLMLTAVLSGCASGVATKSAYEVTVFADEALESALTGIAVSYTDAEKNPNANKNSEILFRFEPSEDLNAKIADKAYYDILIAAGENENASLTVTAADGTVYSLTVSATSDNPDAMNAFIDYLTSGTASAAFTEAGFTVAG